ncbi:BspA family leucine-rich repeat surface protein [Mycoplasma mycoides]|uniref:BspA family leucine-rich repeat surface protein n=1 Tax=Mycoplasma mycoides subsp. capri LC str. 95010 TaxID=862259 RepID=F4MP19_MYCML|nr:BspA family leucine-rich repeat surface protein [Mycoplasma mycoides]QVK06957.1 DUF285 domain-containing protein [Mycoplasma mycoides subsp. capri]CBW53851.1 Conserved hypothetical protein, predicted transmembrane protein, DUF285 family [Mycoplasma mycoides subsp. capri LC str. 95010]
MKKYLKFTILNLMIVPSALLFMLIHKDINSFLYQKLETKKQVKEQNHEYNPSDKSEITKIGFYEKNNKVTIKQIPWYVKKVPDKLPEEIVSLHRAFAHRYKDHGEVIGFEKWDTKNVTDMSYLFYDNHTVNADLSVWNTSKVTNMRGMFKNAINYNNNDKPLDWKTDSVTDMESMFDGATSFNQNLKKWNVTNVNNNKNFSRASGIFEYKDKKPDWKIEEINEHIEKKVEEKPKVIVHPSPPKPKITLPLTKIITPTANPAPNSRSNLETPKSNISITTQQSKKLSTPAIVGIVVGSQVILTSLAAGIPYLIKRFKK